MELGTAIDLHEGYDADQNPLTPSIQPIGTFEIEGLTSNDGALIQHRQPRVPCRSVAYHK